MRDDKLLVTDREKMIQMMNRNLAKQHREQRTKTMTMKFVYVETKDGVITDAKAQEFETDREFFRLIAMEEQLLREVDQFDIAKELKDWSIIARVKPLVVNYCDGSIGTYTVLFD